MIPRRFSYKQWRNGPKGKHTTQITWYHKEKGTDIRLIMEDRVRSESVYPASPEEANRVWDLFVMFSPKADMGNRDQLVVTKLLDYLHEAGIHVTQSK